MPRYEITAPDGRRFEVNAPDGASQDEVMAYAQKSFAPVKPDAPVSPTDGMSGTDKFLAGAGKAFVDVGRGAGQMLGLVDQQSIDEAKKRDAPLMDTGAGVAGNMLGTIAATAPALAVPGANTVAGAAAMGGAMNALQPVATGESRFQNAALGAALGGGGQAVLGKLGQVASNRLTAAEQKAAQLTTQNEARDATAKAAQQAGFVLPPSQVNPSPLNRALEGYAGKLSTQQGASMKNQQVVDALIKKDLGIPADRAVTPELLAGIRKEAGKAYEVVKQAGKLGADDEFSSAIRSLGGEEYAAVVRDVPEMANAEIGKLMQALDKPEFNAQTAVSLIKKLRNDASANFKNRLDPEKLALARAQSDAAEALEGLAERNLAARGMPEAVQNLRQARTLIAKTSQAEEALTEATGSFAASHFGKLADKGKPLSGGMQTVGKVAQVFPKAVQNVNTSMPGVSPLDYAAAGGISAAAGMPGLMSTVMGRPMARGLISSRPYQGLMVNPPNYGPGLLTRGAPTILDELEKLGFGGLLGPSVYAAQ